MGYLHDLDLSVPVSLRMAYKESTAGWATVRQAGPLWAYLKGYAAETLTIKVPVQLPASAGTNQGVMVNSIDFWYEISTADLVTGPTGKVERYELPGDGEAMGTISQETVTLQGSDLDLIGSRMARVSIDAPFWLQPGEVCQAVLEAETAIAAEFYFYGARINFTLRE